MDVARSSSTSDPSICGHDARWTDSGSSSDVDANRSCQTRSVTNGVIGASSSVTT